MRENALLFSFFILFFGAAILATLALYTRQSLLVAYMLVGVFIGPSGLKLIDNAELIQHIGDVGIIFLLFLLGLHMKPHVMIASLKKTTWVTLLTSGSFFLISFVIAYLCGFSRVESAVIGLAMMFSSTIISLKLLPTTALHHQHIGEVMISVLLLQDIIAIVALLSVHAVGQGGIEWSHFLHSVALAVPGVGLLYVFQRRVLVYLFRRFSRIHEYVFLLSIAWCLIVSYLASRIGLSFEIGAFVAGVSLASEPIALYIAESLKPVRDFFLIMFFFSIGAGFNLTYLSSVILPAAILATILTFMKPVLYRLMFKRFSETESISKQLGFRLGQCSEFALILAAASSHAALIGHRADYMIQATTMLSFIFSSYIVVMRYPTPVANVDALRKN